MENKSQVDEKNPYSKDDKVIYAEGRIVKAENKLSHVGAYSCSDGDQGFTQWIDKEHHDKHCKRCRHAK